MGEQHQRMDRPGLLRDTKTILQGTGQQEDEEDRGRGGRTTSKSGHLDFSETQRPSCKAPLGEQEDEEDRGRGGRTTSKSGQAWTSQRHKDHPARHR